MEDFIEGQFDDASEPFDSAEQQQTSVASLWIGDISNELHLPSKNKNRHFLNLPKKFHGLGQFDDAPEPYWSTEQASFLPAVDGSCRESIPAAHDQNAATPTIRRHAPQADCNGYSEHPPSSIKRSKERDQKRPFSRLPSHRHFVAARRLSPKLPMKREAGIDSRDASIESLSCNPKRAADSNVSDVGDGFPTGTETIVIEDNARRFPIDDKNVTTKDVLFGRGGMTNIHPGNVYYRNLVSNYRFAYQTAKKHKKNSISKNIVHFVRSQHGRFLKRSGSDVFWYEVGDEKAIAKTGQALREGMAEMLRSSLQGQIVNDSESNVGDFVRDNDTERQKRKQDTRGRKRQWTSTIV